MKLNVLLCICLAAMIFLIPLATFSWMPEESLLPSQDETASHSGQVSSSRSSSSVSIPSVSLSLSSDAGQTIALPNADTFSIYDQTTGEIHTMSAQEYTICAVSAEMPPTFPEDALRAQAVACYTYALRAKYDNQKDPDPALNGADFSADPSNWKGFSTREQYVSRYGEADGTAYFDQIASAVEPVLGYVMLYQQNPIVAAFHSISAGRTEDASNVWSGSAPYLVPVESEGDLYAPGYETAELFDPAALWEAFSAAGLVEGSTPTDNASGWFTDFERSPSGYITSLTFCGQQLDGMQVRNALGLRSSNFTVEYLNGSFLFRVCGYGHGVGMSQYGAEYLAENGASWQDILQHYYTGITLARVEGIG